MSFHFSTKNTANRYAVSVCLWIGKAAHGLFNLCVNFRFPFKEVWVHCWLQCAYWSFYSYLKHLEMSGTEGSGPLWKMISCDTKHWSHGHTHIIFCLSKEVQRDGPWWEEGTITFTTRCNFEAKGWLVVALATIDSFLATQSSKKPLLLSNSKVRQHGFIKW